MLKWLKKLWKKIPEGDARSPAPTFKKHHTVNPVISGIDPAEKGGSIIGRSTVNIRTLVGAEKDTIDDQHLLKDGYVKMSSVIENGIRKNKYRKVN